MAEGAISAKHKELIALAIGVSQHCSGCIGFHVKALLKISSRFSYHRQRNTAGAQGSGAPPLRLRMRMQVVRFGRGGAVTVQAQLGQ
jgi:AhpD family alkylhydroperoxidase